MGHRGPAVRGKLYELLRDVKPGEMVKAAELAELLDTPKATVQSIVKEFIDEHQVPLVVIERGNVWRGLDERQRAALRVVKAVGALREGAKTLEVVGHGGNGELYLRDPATLAMWKAVKL